jgi:excisionase family DNA binding protein
MKQAMVILASVRRKTDRHFCTSWQIVDALFVKFALIFILLGSIPFSIAYGTRLALCPSVRGVAAGQVRVGVRAISEEQGRVIMAMKLESSRVMTVKELSDYLKVHPSTVYRQLKRGGLPAFKVGSDWRFNIESIDRWRLQQDNFKG